jgi:hypothetical protein
MTDKEAEEVAKIIGKLGETLGDIGAKRIHALEDCVRELRSEAQRLSRFLVGREEDSIEEAIARSLELVPEPQAQPERRMDGKA